jgi:hypothetical protein
VKEIIDGPDRVCRIQVVAVGSGNLRPHAQKTVGQIQIIVAGGGHVEFDEVPPVMFDMGSYSTIIPLSILV